MLKMPAVVLLLAVGGLGAAVQQPDADAHRAWMDDAGDLQDDLRDALRLKEGAKAVEASAKMAALMAQTETYWAAKKADDIVKLAQEARSQSKEMGAAADAAKFDDAEGVFAKLSATCNACHDLHPEKR
jgi:hypothetical protein